MTNHRIALALEIDKAFPHHLDILGGVQAYADDKANWTLIIDEHPGARVRQRPWAARYDGVIARASPTTQKLLTRRKCPLVNVHYQTHRPKVHGVYANPDRIGQIAAEHLIERGFERFALLADADHRHWEEVCKSFVQRCADDEYHADMFPVRETDYLDIDGWVQLEAAISACLDAIEPPAAIFAETSQIARLVIEFAQARGLVVPNDLAVLAFQATETITRIPPQISSIDWNLKRIGTAAAEMLELLISGKTPKERVQLIDPIGVIGRESTDYFAVEDQLVSRTLRYVSSRITEPMHIDDIAYAMNVSTRLLQQRVKQEIGTGLAEEILRLRLEIAKRLLADSERPIGSIPAKAGFSSNNQMTAVFNRKLGMSPRAFRKSLKSHT